MDIINNFNLSEDAEKGSKLILLNPVTGDKTDIVFIVKGADSATHDKLLRDEQLKKAVEGEKYNYDDGMVRMAAGLIVGWENIHDGEDLFPFNYENALFLLSKKAWVFDQVKNFTETRSNFFLG